MAAGSEAVAVYLISLLLFQMIEILLQVQGSSLASHWRMSISHHMIFTGIKRGSPYTQRGEEKHTAPDLHTHDSKDGRTRRH